LGDYEKGEDWRRGPVIFTAGQPMQCGQRRYRLGRGCRPAAIGELLKLLNQERPIRRLGVTRQQLLEEIDRPALNPLPIDLLCPNGRLLLRH
jgi:hypothetical protein